ncbi:hypothetical protein CXB51_025705 [Gossypium anomalum]|uniref:Uncharacterized protein n=1 Tax=Gossypium anomalum TaxID=47600 RepID=A0A8J5YK44_9ROSI|nr:hypothetical protein CXB51_025705 [Gossypium anomalum]
MKLLFFYPFQPPVPNFPMAPQSNTAKPKINGLHLLKAQICYRTFSTFWVFSINQMLLLNPPSLHFPSRRFVLLQSIYISRRNSGRFLPLDPFDPQFNEDDDKRFSVLRSFSSRFSRFSTPTIFLKISCDGGFLVTHIVGEFAVEKLIASFWGDDNGECLDQFYLVKNVVEKLGYEVW